MSSKRSRALLQLSSESLKAAKILETAGLERHARQYWYEAGEKAVLALLEHRGLDPRHERDLGRLARLLPPTDPLRGCICDLARKHRRVPDLLALARSVRRLRAHVMVAMKVLAARPTSAVRSRIDSAHRRSDLGCDARLGAAVARLVEELHPRAVFLFGSRARGDHRPDSDYDLLVVCDHEVDYDVAYRPLAGLGIACDVVPVSVAEWTQADQYAGGVLRAVLDEGQVLYERPGTHAGGRGAGISVRVFVKRCVAGGPRAGRVHRVLGMGNSR